jgi:ABC-type sugar transport system ATPase subunit
MVAGLEEISEGVLKIGERVVNHVPSRDRDIAMVFQSYALYPHLSVYENIAFGLKVKKVPKDEIDRRVHEAARILDLETFLKRKPRALSGGQRQRVAMGRAIVREPSAFLMDEPLSNLDAKLRVQMRAEISQLQHNLGVTTIYVTHDQIEAMTMGDRVAVMHDGVLEQVADTRTIYERPANVFVAGFIGSPSMSFATLGVTRDDSSLDLRKGELSLSLSLEAGALPELPAEVTVGIRPEHTRLWRSDDGLVGPVEGRASFVEMLGRETLIGVDTGGGEHFTVLADADEEIAAGDAVRFGVEPGRVYLFDPATTDSLAIV